MLGFKKVEGDGLYNRRRIFIFMLLYAIVWGFVILTVATYYELDTPKIVAYLGFVATVGGLPVWQYLKAASAPQERDKDG